MKGRGSIIRKCEICRESFRISTGTARKPGCGRFCSTPCTTLARHQGLVKSGPRTRCGKPVRPWTEAEIEEMHRSYVKVGPTMMGRRLRRPKTSVVTKARALGLVRQVVRHWTPEEEDWLEANIARLSWKSLAAHLDRTVFAVQVRAKALRASRLDGGNGMSARQAALIFGVDVHKVLGWIDRGLVRGTKVAHIGPQGTWHIAPSELRRFAFDSPGAYDIRKVDHLLLLDLLGGNRAATRFEAKAPKEESA